MAKRKSKPVADVESDVVVDDAADTDVIDDHDEPVVKDVVADEAEKAPEVPVSHDEPEPKPVPPPDCTCPYDPARLAKAAELYGLQRHTLEETAQALFDHFGLQGKKEVCFRRVCQLAGV